MITMDDEEIKQYASDLKTFAAKAYPFATKQTINKAAFGAQRGIKAAIGIKFTERNKFTQRSIRVEKARGLNVRTQEAVVGSTADYMETQEFGGQKARKGGVGVPLPTTISTGEGQGVKPRRKVPKGRMKLSKIKFSKTGKSKFKSKKQELFVKVLLASRSGNKFLFLDTGKKKAIYRVKGKGRGAKLSMTHDLSHTSVTIPRTKIIQPATIGVTKFIPQWYKKAMVEQLKRHNLFKD